MKRNKSAFGPLLKIASPVLMLLVSLPRAYSQNIDPLNDGQRTLVQAQVVHNGQMITILVGVFLMAVTAWRFHKDHMELEDDL